VDLFRAVTVTSAAILCAMGHAEIAANIAKLPELLRKGQTENGAA
jgi:hypothetical protein